MIIIEAAGGLGNQLQQYALYRKFLSLGKEAKLDLSWFDEENQKNMLAKRKLELDYFDGLFYEVCTPLEKAVLTGGDGLLGKIRRRSLPFTTHIFRESAMFHPELLTYSDMYISGYFACEKYYADILDDLQKEIQFPEKGRLRCRKLAKEMAGCESVSVHIRRGDYLDKENAAMFGNICTDAYYGQAIEMLKREVPGAHFYIFSDDASYAKKKYGKDEFTVVDINHGKDSFYDMWLMSNCRHNICANSTFSFWGARLNGHKDKIMVRPAVHKNSQTFVKEEMVVLWKGWRFIDSQGKIR